MRVFRLVRFCALVLLALAQGCRSRPTRAASLSGLSAERERLSLDRSLQAVQLQKRPPNKMPPAKRQPPPRPPLPPPSPPPALPAWVQPGVIDPTWWPDQKAAARAVKKLNANRRRRLDVALFGDSLTAGFMRRVGQQTWSRHFADLDALPLGMRGSSVEQLVWRMLKGGELPARPPRLAVFFIGVNNVIRGETRPAETARRLEWLVQWVKSNWPDTKVAVAALLPHNWDHARDVAPTNAELEALARRQQAEFLRCGQGWSPGDSSIFNDGLHLNRNGMDRLAACFRAGVARALGSRRV